MQMRFIRADVNKMADVAEAETTVNGLLNRGYELFSLDVVTGTPFVIFVLIQKGEEEAEQEELDRLLGRRR